MYVNKNVDSLERENGASFCHLWMGNLVIYILLRQALICQSAPGSSRQQQHLLQDLFHIYRLVHLLFGYKQPILDAN